VIKFNRRDIYLQTGQGFEICCRYFQPIRQTIIWDMAQIVDGLAFLSTKNWTTQEEVSDLAGGVPDPLAQRWIPKWATSSYGGMAVNWNTVYPPVWPFEKPGAD